MKERLLRAILPLLLRVVLPIFRPLHRFFTEMNITLFQLRRCFLWSTRPTDIFLCTYPKSGTTWLQMILYQLQTDGDMERIPHLSIAIPHFEESALPIEGLPNPRVFKSHLPFWAVPKGGKMIYVTRDGQDVANSFFHHMQTVKLYKGSFDQFFDAFLAGRVPYRSWFAHLAGWSKARSRPDVLVVHYEDMLADLEREVRRIAAFCGIPIDETQMPRILERCSFAYMKTQEDKLDVGTYERHLQAMISARQTDVMFIREGKKGKGRDRLSEAQRARYATVFTKQLRGFGWDRYDTTRQPDRSVSQSGGEVLAP